MLLAPSLCRSLLTPLADVRVRQAGDSVAGTTNVDPTRYLDGLSSVAMLSDADIGDLKKAELLLESVIQTNPLHGPGWIAAARLQEKAGKLAQARKYIRRGCEACPDNEDVWLEASRLHVCACLSLFVSLCCVVVGVGLTCAQTPDVAKSILADAVKAIPRSVKIWLAATRLEARPLSPYHPGFVCVVVSVCLADGGVAGRRTSRSSGASCDGRSSLSRTRSSSGTHSLSVRSSLCHRLLSVFSVCHMV
jgi:hypothetical protein